MSQYVYFMTTGLVLGAIVLIFGMKYFSAAQQAKARFAHEDAYRQVAEKAATAQSETAAALSSIQASLSDVRTRLGAVEKVLKEVE